MYHLPQTVYKVRPHTDFIAIHCSATSPTTQFGVDACRRFHTTPKPHGRGWMDIGYHFYIERSGVLALGRPVWATGAHVFGFNDSSVGVCYEGGISTPSMMNPAGDPADNMTPEQRVTLLSTVSLLKSLYPNAVVQGHRNFPNVNKACPSFDAEAWWARAAR